LTLRGKLTLAILAVIMLMAIYSAYAFLGQADMPTATPPPVASLPPVLPPEGVTPSAPPSSSPADPTPGTSPDAPGSAPSFPISPDTPEPRPDPNVPEEPDIPNVPDVPSVPSFAPAVSGQIPQAKLTVYFMPGDVALSDMARDDLQKFVHMVPGFQNVFILIEGSALPGEYEGEPEELAGRRAHAIAEYLKELGVPVDRTVPTTFSTPNSEFSGAILSYTSRNGK
jgi:outer membrane protein OmpA-like peptidoglycan-associated protein